MALVAAKCTECGANIEVDDCKEAGICNFCGTAFVTQKVINENHTHVTKNITKNVFGKKGKSAENYCDDGETFLKLKDWEKAEEAFEEATTLEPRNYLGWFGLVKVYTENFSDLYDEVHEEYLVKALAVANEEEKRNIVSMLEAYKKTQLANAESKLENYAPMITKANKARRANKRAEVVCWITTIPFSLVLIFVWIPILLWYKKYYPQKRIFYNSVLDAIILERELDKHNLERPAVRKEWCDIKLAKKFPALYCDRLTEEEIRQRINILTG